MVLGEGTLTFKEFAAKEKLPLSGIHNAVLEFLQGRDDAVIYGAHAVNAYVDETRMTQDLQNRGHDAGRAHRVESHCVSSAAWKTEIWYRLARHRQRERRTLHRVARRKVLRRIVRTRPTWSGRSPTLDMRNREGAGTTSSTPSSVLSGDNVAESSMSFRERIFQSHRVEHGDLHLGKTPRVVYLSS